MNANKNNGYFTGKLTEGAVAPPMLRSRNAVPETPGGTVTFT
jgi:hypothetical protein